jgi:Pyruvate/2-oxoacid:ferredoxin oxidoreductase gamma subunit
VQRDVWQAVTDAARTHASEDGGVRMTNLVLLAAGQA